MMPLYDNNTPKAAREAEIEREREDEEAFDENFETQGKADITFASLA